MHFMQPEKEEERKSKGKIITIIETCIQITEHLNMSRNSLLSFTYKDKSVNLVFACKHAPLCKPHP